MRTASVSEGKMGKESSGMEPQPQHKNQNLQSRRKAKKRWEDEINDFLRPEETDETKGNDVKAQWHVDQDSERSEEFGVKWKTNSQLRQHNHLVIEDSAEDGWISTTRTSNMLHDLPVT